MDQLDYWDGACRAGGLATQLPKIRTHHSGCGEHVEAIWQLSEPGADWQRRAVDSARGDAATCGQVTQLHWFKTHVPRDRPNAALRNTPWLIETRAAGKILQHAYWSRWWQPIIIIWTRGSGDVG